jgi:alpha-aminoadipate carrier protein LysW
LFLYYKSCDVEMIVKCPECGCDVEIPDDSENGELVNCPSCGIELENKNGVFCQSEMLEGEDWGE